MTAAMLMTAFTADTAHACMATCIARYGLLTQKSLGVWWEMVSCTSSETVDGPVYITCYYVEYDFN